MDSDKCQSAVVAVVSNVSDRLLQLNRRWMPCISNRAYGSVNVHKRGFDERSSVWTKCVFSNAVELGEVFDELFFITVL